MTDELSISPKRRCADPTDPPSGSGSYTPRKASFSSVASTWLGRRGIKFDSIDPSIQLEISKRKSFGTIRKVAIPALNDSPYIGMNVYNVVLTSIIVVFCGSLLTARTTLYYIVVSTLILTSTTTALCLLFLPKVNQTIVRVIQTKSKGCLRLILSTVPCRVETSQWRSHHRSHLPKHWIEAGIQYQKVFHQPFSVYKRWIVTRSD